jgi:hypothetical protein
VLAVGEDLVLHRKERAAGVDEVDAGQAILQRHFLGPQVLLHGDRVVGASFDGGVVGHHDALAAGHPPDPGDHASAGAPAVVHALGGQRRELEEGAPGVEQVVDALAGKELAPVDVLGTCRRGAALAPLAQPLAKICRERQVAQPRRCRC